MRRMPLELLLVLVIGGIAAIAAAFLIARKLRRDEGVSSGAGARPRLQG